MPPRPLSFETLGVSPFELHAGAIEALREDDLVRLVNTLIWDEGRRLGVPATAIRVTLRTKDPDGGIDALTDVGARDSRYLRSGEMVWQFKRSWPDRARLRDRDLAAPGAKEAFERGAGYTLVVGEGMVPRTHLSRLRTLEGLARDEGCRGPVQLLDAEQVARWTSSVPGAHLELVWSLRGYQRADRVLADGRHSTPYEPDQARREAMADITALCSPTPPRVTGPESRVPRASERPDSPWRPSSQLALLI